MTKKLDPETKARKARVEDLGLVSAERFSTTSVGIGRPQRSSPRCAKPSVAVLPI